MLARVIIFCFQILPELLYHSSYLSIIEAFCALEVVSFLEFRYKVSLLIELCIMSAPSSNVSEYSFEMSWKRLSSLLDSLWWIKSHRIEVFFTSRNEIVISSLSSFNTLNYFDSFNSLIVFGFLLLIDNHLFSLCKIES